MLSCRVVAHVIVSPRLSNVVPGLHTRMDERDYNRGLSHMHGFSAKVRVTLKIERLKKFSKTTYHVTSDIKCRI